MRKWVLAAVAALAVGQAEAATFRLEYFSWSHWADDEYEADKTYYTRFKVGFKPSVVAMFEADDQSNLSIGLPDLDSIIFNWGGYIVPVSSFYLTTNDDGSIKSISGSGVDLFTFNGTVGSGSVWHSECCTTSYLSKGKWRLTNLDAPPVPLPATAGLLLTAVAGLGALKRRDRHNR